LIATFAALCPSSPLVARAECALRPRRQPGRLAHTADLERQPLERKSILAIASWSIVAWGKVEHSDMRVCKSVLKRLWCIVIVGWAFQAALPQEPDPDEHAGAVAPPSPAGSICALVEEAAQAHGLPLDFFARLIWQESRFNPALIGPARHNGQRAQGIAQFMPDTTRERGAFDPFDPSAALLKSAEFLHDLRVQFGNLGLAAAAYNAGPKRVRDWLAGRSSLPGQTRTYVSAITGRSADDWAKHLDDKHLDDGHVDSRHLDDGHHGGSRDTTPDKGTSCDDLIALLKADPIVYTNAPAWHAREFAEL
jgi:hypothetical protein